MNFDPQRAVQLLVCPQTHAALVYDGRSLVNTDPQTRLRYTVRDDIPVMLVDEAQSVPVDEWTGLMRKHGRDPQTGQLLAPAGSGFPAATQEEPR
ncbi:MAG: Trm112 family protein [Planctomycetaceae bacterium]